MLQFERQGVNVALKLKKGLIFFFLCIEKIGFMMNILLTGYYNQKLPILEFAVYFDFDLVKFFST